MAPRRSTASGSQATPSTAAKGKDRKPARLPSSDAEEESDGGRLPKFEHVQMQYLNQPVDGKQSDTKLRALLAELKLLKKELGTTLEVLGEAASDVAESSAKKAEEVEEMEDEVPEDEPTTKRLDKEFRLVLDKQHEINLRSSALSELRQRVVQGHEIRNIIDVYEKSVHPTLENYASKTSRQKYMENEEYISFRNLIWENLYDGRAVPNIKKMIPAEPNDEEDSDDEIEIGAQQADFRCPLTLTILADPMTSTICPHYFSGAAIRDYLKNGEAACPIPGCNKTLSMEVMREDGNLKRRVEAHERREAEGGNGKTATQFQTIDSDSDE